METGTGVQTTPARRPAAGPRLSGSVLVVDDDEPIRRLFAELFRPEEVALRLAASAADALALVKQAAPALLIVDVTLPDRDGIALLEDAQRIDPRMIGVVMTGSPSVALAVRAMKAGASDFLLKPLETGAIAATVRRLLDLHRRRAERTVVKQDAVRAGAVRLQRPPLQTFGEDGVLRGADGLTDFERGLAEGARRAEERRRHERAMLAEAVRGLVAARADVQRTMEEDVIALAFQIATKVLHEAAATCKEPIVAQARTALAALKDAGPVVIQVHPADAAPLEAARAELAQQQESPVTVRIQPVPSLSRGTCLVRATNHVVDASLDRQLLRLGEALARRTGHEAR